MCSKTLYYAVKLKFNFTVVKTYLLRVLDCLYQNALCHLNNVRGCACYPKVQYRFRLSGIVPIENKQGY